MKLTDIHLTQPSLALVALLLIFIAVYLFVRAEKASTIVTNQSPQLRSSFGIWNIASYLRLALILSIGIVLSIILAGPYILGSDIEVKKDGIDVVVVMDVSWSMDFQDFKPSRLELAKSTLQDFISEIRSDRVGLIVFAGKPISSQPLTFDYAIINETLQSLSTNIINQNVPGLSGTNIGDALLLAKGLFDTPDREKIILLLTDWDANSGADPQLTAAVLAEENITIYSIGIWKDSPSEMLLNNGFFNQKQTIPPLNSAILESIADTTWGVFFRAWDNDTLRAIFEKLKQLQTSEITTQVKQYRSDHSTVFIYIAIILLALLNFIELIYPKCK